MEGNVDQRRILLPTSISKFCTKDWIFAVERECQIGIRENFEFKLDERWRKCLNNLIFILMHFHCIFSLTRLFQSVMEIKECFNPEQCIVHGMMASAGCFAIILQHLFFRREKEIPVIIFNEMFTAAPSTSTGTWTMQK